MPPIPIVPALARVPLLGLALLVCAAVPADARNRNVCDDPVFGICALGCQTHSCGGDQQMACDTGAPCDPGNRHLTSTFLSGLPVVVDCGGLFTESISGVCVACGGHAEPRCLGPSNVCDPGLVSTTTASLSGPIDACETSLPPLPVSSFSVNGTVIPVPPITTWITTYGVCSNAAPDDLSGSESREPWPREESTPGERETILIVHGRGGSCTDNRNLMGEQVRNRNHLVYCIEYAQPVPAAPGPQAPKSIRSVRALALRADLEGTGASGCAAGDCVFARDRPVFEVEAPALTVSSTAAALAEVIEKIPTVGRISILAHSQGGYITRQLLHAHYDDLRWKGKEITRVLGLAHPWFAKEQDPQVYPNWACLKSDADENYDCAVGRWMKGWDDWLAGNPIHIDDTDFPQIDWAGMAGDGLDQSNACGDDPLPPTCPPQSPLEPAFTTLEEGEACSFIMGGVAHSSVAGDTSVPIQSSLGIDEHDFYPIERLQFDSGREGRCQHTGTCHLDNALADDPLRLLAVPAVPHTTGAVAFDGVDDYLAVVSASENAALAVTGALTLELWIRPEVEGQSEVILNKEGEYQLLLSNGQLAWAISNGIPGWASQPTGWTPPVHQWTHFAFVYDPVAQTATSHVNGSPVAVQAASGAIGDFVPALDEFWLASRQSFPADHFAGRLDDVRIWNRALTLAEVSAALQSAVDPGDPNLLAWWDFETLSSGSSHASVTASPSATLAPPSAAATPLRPASPEVLSDAFPGGALYFDGTNDRVTISDPTALAALEGGPGELTLEAWVAPRSASGGLGGVILNKEGEYALVRSTNGTIWYSLANTTPGWVSVDTGIALPEDTWTHVALTYSDSTNQVKIFVAGEEAYSAFADGPIGDADAREELQIGARQANDTSGPATDQWFLGALDEVRVWKRALSGPEIQARMHTPLDAASETALAGYWRFDELELGFVAGRSSSGTAPHGRLGRNQSGEIPHRIRAAAIPGHPSGLSPDTDGDGLADADELAIGTNPGLSDSDGDGLSDGFEARHALSPLATGDASADPDGDGLDNAAEQAAGTDPNQADSDGDGIDDDDELTLTETDPRVAQFFGPVLYASERDANVVLAIDVETGNREIVSGGTTGSGPVIGEPMGVAVEPGGTLLLTDLGNDRLLRIDPQTGDRTIVEGAGPPWGVPVDLVVESASSALVADQGTPDRIFRIDLATGDRSDLVAALAETPLSAALEASGNLLLSDTVQGRIVRVDTPTGVVDVVTSNSVGSGPAIGQWQGIAVAHDGSILAVDGTNDRLLRVDPVSGARTIVSDASTGAGPPFELPRGVVAVSSQFALVGDRSIDKLIRVELKTGNRSIIADALTGRGPSLGFLEDLTWFAGLDQDGDRLPDLFEVRFGSDPLVAAPPSRDGDGDGLTDEAEHLLGSDPTLSDSDGDGLNDDVEAASGSNPTLADTDGDGVSDFDETYATGTDPTAPQPFGPGILVGEDAADSLIEVDLATGRRTRVSGAGVGSGPEFTSIHGIAEERSGTLLVVDSAANRLLRVDPVSGARSIVSDGGVGSGPALIQPRDVVVDASGTAVVSATHAVSELIRVDPVSGDRSLLASFPASSEVALAFEPTGDLLATDATMHGVRRVDPVTGAFTTLTGGAIGSGPVLTEPTGIDVEPDGSLLVVDRSGRALVRVDPATGDRTIVSNSSVGLPDPAEEDPPRFETCVLQPTPEVRAAFCAPVGLALTSGGAGALIVDPGSAFDPREMLVWVDTTTGHRTIVSFRYRGQGPPLAQPRDVLAYRGLDQDGDGLPDLDELTRSTKPLDTDSDGDGLEDGDEVALHLTDPTRVDTDSDGFGDGAEVAAGTDPLDPGSNPGPPQVPTISSLARVAMLAALMMLAAADARRVRRSTGSTNPECESTCSISSPGKR